MYRTLISGNTGTRNGIAQFPLMLMQLRHVKERYSEKIYERLRSIFAKCGHQFGREIVASADFTLDASKHDDFAQLLM